MTDDEKKAARAAYMREWRRQNPEAARAAGQRKRQNIMADPERAERHRAYQRAKQAQYRERHPERRKATARKSEMLRHYGLTVEQYDAMVEAQNGLCALCGRPPPEDRRLSVDHDHECCPGFGSCGKCIRGLLCDPCNGGLGLLGDSTAMLEKALAYLRQWEAA